MVEQDWLPDFVCPRCRRPVQRDRSGYRCSPCSADYPVVLGIADFRVFPDPWIGLEEDREKACRLDAVSAGLDFEATVRAYWVMTPDTPTASSDRFISSVLCAEPRAEQWLDSLPVASAVRPGSVWLDIGTGTAPLAAAIARRGGSVIAVDIAFRWLLVARRRPSFPGANVHLVCANGEHLPFADSVVDHVVAVSALEHCRDARAVVAEGARVLVPGGSMRVRAVNRYSLLREPHVGVWGVGLVPRRFVDAFVRWRTGQRYLHHRPLSRSELLRVFRNAGLVDVRADCAPLLAADALHLRGLLAWAGRVYGILRTLPLVRDGLAWFAPELELSAAATSTGTVTHSPR